MNQTQKIRLLLNEPKFLKQHLRKTDTNLFFSHKNLQSLYPAYSQIERFKNMQEARLKMLRDKDIDSKVIELIQLLKLMVKQIQTTDKSLQSKKQQIVKKFTIQKYKKELQMSMQRLEVSISNYSKVRQSIKTEKQQISKMMKTTQIRKALLMQNQILQEENRRLKLRDQMLDKKLAS